MRGMAPFHKGFRPVVCDNWTTTKDGPGSVGALLFRGLADCKESTMAKSAPLSCTVANCACRHHARGFCNKHYLNWRKHGTPIAPQPTLADRFWPKVDRSGGPDACWLWTASTDLSGYGKIAVCGRGTLTGAHRVAYELSIGPIPNDLHLDHLCRVRHCVNPAHLEPVTVAENNRRAHAARRQERAA